MPNSLPLTLVYKMSIDIRILFNNIILDLITQVADNEDKFSYTCIT